MTNTEEEKARGMASDLRRAVWALAVLVDATVELVLDELDLWSSEAGYVTSRQVGLKAARETAEDLIARYGMGGDQP